jgi:hypothetical protein
MIGVLVALGLCLVAVVVGFAPFLLPWPVRLRWMIVTAAADPWTARALPLALDECHIEAVRVTDAGLVLVPHRDGVATELLHVPTATPSDRDQLERWLATRTPLLMDTRAGGDVILSGSTGSITAFRYLDPEAALLPTDDDAPTLGELTLDDLILLGRV